MNPTDSVCQTILDLKIKVLAGAEPSFEEAMFLAGLEDPSALECLYGAAGAITRHFHGKDVALCSLINAKSYLCPEDCGFCAQSLHYSTGARQYGLVPADEVLAAATRAEAAGIRDFCIVTSGAELTDEEFERVLGMFRRLRRETKLNLDGSLGWLEPERIRKLREAGVRRINNNLQTSREHYGKIVSTHSFDKRVESLKGLQAGGMEICAGGILGLGESREDRVRLAFELKPYSPHCIPINLLDPRPGTPLADQAPMAVTEILKTVAIFRFIHPRANIKLAGGREKNLSPRDQEKALQSGANGLIVGGYLTSAGNPVSKDLEMISRIGASIGT
ncbi:MAG: biotin synthase BioB [Candidatus Omnitrophota bacterium]|jgi:biotin synthase